MMSVSVIPMVSFEQENLWGLNLKRMNLGKERTFYDFYSLNAVLKLDVSTFFAGFVPNSDYIEYRESLTGDPSLWITWEVLVEGIFHSRTEDGKYLKRHVSNQLRCFTRNDIQNNICVKDIVPVSNLMLDISHDFRTPLNGCMGALELALNSVNTDEQREYLNIMADSLEQLSIEVENIIEIVHLGIEKPKLMYSTFNPFILLQDLVQQFSRAALFKNRKIILKPPSALELNHLFLGDERKLKQIIRKIIAIAFKHATGCQLNIQASLVPDNASFAYFHVEVSDPQTTIFSFLENKSPTPASIHHSAIMKELTVPKVLVELMQGELKLSGKQIFHCAFRVGLSTTSPIVPLQISVEEKPKMMQVDVSPYKVLVVEDNLVNLKIVCKLLSQQKRWPLKIETAANGQMGLEMMKKCKFDLVLMDCQMPIMDGFEAVTLYREFERNVKSSPVPIVACTAQGLGSEQQKCFDVGMNGLLAKPLKLKDLEKVLEQFLE